MSRKAKVLISLVLIVFCIIQILPFYFAVTTAFKDRSDLSSVWELPLHGATTDNFVAAVQDGNILRAMLNSGIVTIVVTILTCLLSSRPATHRLQPGDYSLHARSNDGSPAEYLGSVVFDAERHAPAQHLSRNHIAIVVPGPTPSHLPVFAVHTLNSSRHGRGGLG